MKEMTRDKIARRIEEGLKKHAGVIRNLINEGHTLTGAMQDDRAKFWIQEIEKTAQELNNL